MSTIIRNNKAYDSGDAEATINGFSLDIVEISYETEQEHQLNHTLKNKATSWSRGKITPTATMTVMMHDIAPIERAAGGDLLSIKPFDINMTYINEYNVPVNDTIVAKFQNQGREVTGDMGLNKQYTLFVLDIKFNNPI
ncbi:MAG: hypothetical protein JNM71_12765 [Flavobacterium lindanitolerans]|uniref:hypothetical protein n=1 Tax=Flavobacterium lindanitolerans TaxID=428988 RepID=UPI001A4C8A96|nr:hypothetical protein [Flavobacterium lindanitolerans]MBL7868879.1 hypothetical protein [Flavobacterium lindanitolerans]